MSAFTAMLASSYGPSSEGDSSANPADLSLPSEADSFDSDRARDRFTNGGSSELKPGQASRNGWRPKAPGASSEGWEARDPPGTARKPQRRQTSPLSSEATPGASAYKNPPPSSFVDVPSPASPSRPAHHFRHASSSSSTILSDFAGIDDDDLFSQSPMGSPTKRSLLAPNPGPAANSVAASKARDFSAGSTALQNSTATAKIKNNASYRSGRASVAGGEIGGRSSMTLREQEKILNERDQEILDLKFRLHFLQQRLSDNSSESQQAVLSELAEVRSAYNRLLIESKKNKKLAVESQKAIEELKRENALLRRDGEASGRSRGREGELTAKLREEGDARSRAEEEAKREKARAERLDRELRELRDRRQGESDDREVELEDLRSKFDDLDVENQDLVAQVEKVSHELDELRQQTAENQGSAELEQRVQQLQEEAQQKDQDIAELERDHDLLIDEREALEQEIANLQNGEGHVDVDVDQLRDELTAAGIELERKTGEVEEKERAIEDAYRQLDQDHEKWAAEADELKHENEILAQNNKEMDQIIVQLEEQIQDAGDSKRKLAEAEALSQELSEKFNEHLNGCEGDKELLAQLEQEIQVNNQELAELSHRIQDLEDDIAQANEVEQELRAENANQCAEFEDANANNEQIIALLKEKHASLKTDLVELTENYNAAQDDLKMQRKQVTDLAGLVKELESRAKRLALERDDLAGALKREANAHVEDVEHGKRMLTDKEAAIARLHSDLDDARNRVSLRDRDFDFLQEGVRQQGESHTNDRFALELEVERVKRDLQRAEEDLEQLRRDLSKKDYALGEREDTIAELRVTGREVENKLAAERQARLNVADKLDSVQKSLKTSEVESHTLRERVDDLETRLTDDQRALMMSRTQSESQRRESSELLLTVFQNVNKILGAEDRTTPANFGLFRETLLMRIGSLGKLQVDFEKKVKLCEQAFADKLKTINRQLDSKWKQLDQFEVMVRKVELVKTAWKTRFAQKQGELEALVSKHADLSSQYTALKGLAKSDSSSELKALTTRNATLERRLANAQNQLTTYDDKMESARQKMSTAETRWDARVKEYERIIKAGEERVKSEKQGGKERAAQLEGQVKDLQKQVETANRRNERVRSLLPPENPKAFHLLNP